jgi:alcohol dehydrogenase class IV
MLHDMTSVDESREGTWKASSTASRRVASSAEGPSGARRAQGELSQSKRVLVVYGSDHIEKSGLLKEATDSLEEAGFQLWTLSGVVPNPCIGLAYKGNDIVRKNGIDCVLGIGGGSVMDTAKAIGAAARHDGDYIDFTRGTFVESSMPVGVISAPRRLAPRAPCSPSSPSRPTACSPSAG